jgi:hypothetical protein
MPAFEYLAITSHSVSRELCKFRETLFVLFHPIGEHWLVMANYFTNAGAGPSGVSKTARSSPVAL